MLDGVMKNFDLRKVPLCSCVRATELPVHSLASPSSPLFQLQVAVPDLDLDLILDLDQPSQVWTLKSSVQTTVRPVRNKFRLAKSFSHPPIPWAYATSTTLRGEPTRRSIISV